MGKGRLEAFGDGVIAIIITIMVLELRAPAGAAFEDLRALAPTFLSYALSFSYVGIYWNNHHHLLKAARSISGAIMWANMHLLFWLSMIPFATSWMGEHPNQPAPAALYGGVLLMCALSYFILARQLVRHEGADSAMAQAMGGRLWEDRKGLLSGSIISAGIAAAFVAPHIAQAIYVIVSLIWFAPDKRIERAIAAESR